MERGIEVEHSMVILTEEVEENGLSGLKVRILILLECLLECFEEC